MNTKSSNIIKTFIPYIIATSLAYIIGVVTFIALPKRSIEFKKDDIVALEYTVYNIKKTLEGEVVQVTTAQPIQVKKPEYKLLSNIKLLAIYAMSDSKGWIIIEDKSSNTHMLEQHEEFKGYKLTSVFNTYVVFQKDSQEYKLSLKDDEKKLNYDVIKTNDSTNKIEEKIKVNDGKVTIQRDYVNNYINDLNKIWQDISINETKDSNGKINGFKIDRLKANSAFEKLGLKKGDIIKEINNIELKSYNDAFDIYKKINNIKNLHIKALRNNQEVELDYEIK